jgi:hypothetical protein
MCCAADFLKMNVTLRDQDVPSTAQAISALEVIGQALLEGGALRVEALKVLAVAASNNVPFQRTVLHYQKLFVPFLIDVRSSPAKRPRVCA